MAFDLKIYGSFLDLETRGGSMEHLVAYPKLAFFIGSGGYMIGPRGV